MGELLGVDRLEGSIEMVADRGLARNVLEQPSRSVILE